MSYVTSTPIPEKVTSYCQSKGLYSPRIVPAGSCYRALATDRNGETQFIPAEVYYDVVAE